MLKIIILSGVPGSGKSTLVTKLERDLSEKGFSVRTVSADHYFMDNGEYKFDPTKLGLAHANCLRRFMAGISNRSLHGDYAIIVDNTNCTSLELAPYVAIALAEKAIANVEIELVSIHCDVEKAAARNVHGVPLATVKRMGAALEARKLPPFWDIKVTNFTSEEVQGL